LLAPPPAFAGRDWDDDDDRHSRRHHHRHHHDGDHHHRGRHHHRHGDWCPPHHARPYAYGWGPRRHHVRHARYHCEPCSRWYDDEPSFHYHVHHHHHVPSGVIPLVIMATVFGAVFSGY
jgi:hypothetical protein